MLHPLFSTLIHRPDLLVEHLSGYAALLHEETSEVGAELLERSLAWVLVALCAAVFLALAGVALMLGVMLQQFHWVLVATPAAVLLLLALALVKARVPPRPSRFAELKAQVSRDADALRMTA